MKNHVKVYLNHFDLLGEFIPCEICGSKAVDIHHVKGRGKGKDVIENLMALCRDCHNKAHSTISKNEVQDMHNKYLNL